MFILALFGPAAADLGSTILRMRSSEPRAGLLAKGFHRKAIILAMRLVMIIIVRIKVTVIMIVMMIVMMIVSINRKQ